MKAPESVDAAEPIVDVTESATNGLSSVTVTLSPMRHRHIDAVVGIESRVYPRGWTTSMFTDELDRPGRCYVVARVGDRVVGYAGMLLIVDDGHVATVVVDPEAWGAKIATRLMLEIIRGGIALGAEQLTLEVRVSNDRARLLYQRFGFVPAGVRKGYYADTNEDALVMWAHDVTSPDYRDRLDGIEATLTPATARVGFDADARPRLHPARMES